jgi:nucleoside-diphosphate-sugar epimerase
VQCVQQAFAWRVKLSAAWGRIFFLYGPHEHPNRLVSYVIRKLLLREQALCSTGDKTRDFLYVKDVADAFVTLLASEVSGPVNIGSGVGVSIKDVVTKISDILDGNELVRFGLVPAPLDEPQLLVADTRRLTEEVGWQPQWNLTSGLEETIGWWRNRLTSQDAVEINGG